MKSSPGAMLAAWRIARHRPGQRERFSTLVERFAEKVKALEATESAVPAEFVTPLWHGFNQRFKTALGQKPDYAFLREKVVMDTMLVTSRDLLRNQLPHVVATHGAKPTFREALLEDSVGRPFIADARHATSANTVHHLYHLAMWEATTKASGKELGTVVEWGGGYGNMAKLVRRLHAPKGTYVIVDSPFMSALQWLYLASCLGEGEVCLHTESTPVQAGQINLVPLQFLDSVPTQCDLFLSTWALSESGGAAVDHVSKRDFFGARHLLLAYQHEEESVPETERVGRIAQDAGATVVPQPLLPGNWYALK